MDPDFTAPEFLNYHFWEVSREWPSDPPGYVFLARALDEIGRSMYGPQWTQVDTKTPEPDVPAPGCERLVWEQVLRDGEQYEEELERKLGQRWKKVIRSVAESCKNGTLIVAARHKSNDAMIKMEPSFWKTRNYASYFYRCDASLVPPFTAPEDKRDHWIYVTRASLDANLEALSLAKPRLGRPPGTGSMAEIDEPLIQKMLQLLKDRTARSPNDAAKQVAGEARGNSFMSKQSRLRKRFVTRFPDWKQELPSK